MAQFSLLEKYDALQRSPSLGGNTALAGSVGGLSDRPSAAGTQFRRQEQAYGRALRILDRQARRGDADAAMNSIAAREKAMASGYAPGGIRSAAEKQADYSEREASMQREIAAREQGAGALGAMAGEAAPVTPTTPVTPVAPLSFAEQERIKREESTRSGAFGTGAADKLKKKDAAATKWWERASNRAGQFSSLA